MRKQVKKPWLLSYNRSMWSYALFAYFVIAKWAQTMKSKKNIRHTITLNSPPADLKRVNLHSRLAQGWKKGGKSKISIKRLAFKNQVSLIMSTCVWRGSSLVWTSMWLPRLWCDFTQQNRIGVANEVLRTTARAQWMSALLPDIKS